MRKFFAIISFISIILTLLLVYVHIVDDVSFVDEQLNQSPEIKLSNSIFYIFCNEYIDNQNSENNLDIGLYCKYIEESIYFNNVNVLLIANKDTVQYNYINLHTNSGISRDKQVFNFKEISDTNKLIVPVEYHWISYVFTFEKYKPKEFQNLSIIIEYFNNNKKQTFQKNIKLRRLITRNFRPLDAHNDISFLFIPIFGLFSIIFILCWYFVRREELKSDKNKN